MAIITIPTIGESPHLYGLIEVLLSDPSTDKILLTVNLPNISLNVPKDSRIQIVETFQLGVSIYYGWRHALEVAKQANQLLGILNDDIIFTCDSPITNAVHYFNTINNLGILGYNYAVCSTDMPEIRTTWGSYRHGGVSGAAFMVNPQVFATPDPKYNWWYSEDDAFVRTTNAGYVEAVANHLTYDHVSETTARNHLWTFEARAQDRILWEQEHGIGTG